MNISIDTKRREGIITRAENIKTGCERIIECCGVLADSCMAGTPVTLSGKSHHINSAVDTAEKTVIECNELGREIFTLAENESGDTANNFFPLNKLYRLEKVPGEKMYIMILPYLMYSKLMHKGVPFKTGRGRFSKMITQSCIDGYINNMEKPHRNTEFFNGRPVPPVEMMEEPHLFFLYHFAQNKRSLDADNIETKRIIDILDGVFFRGDASTNLMTTYFGVQDDDDFTEIIIAERCDMDTVWKMVRTKTDEAFRRYSQEPNRSGRRKSK